MQMKPEKPGRRTASAARAARGVPVRGGRRPPGDGGLDEAITCASALIVAGQDAGRYHIGVGARSRTTAASLLPVSLLAQQRLTEPVELGDHLLRRRSNSLTGSFAQLLQLPG